MNKSNFNQTQGYPLTTERLQELQTSFEILNVFGSLAGNFTIIEGCNLVGTTVQNGFIFLNGELLEFKQASVTPVSQVIIIETPVLRNFENAPAKEVYTKRHATFGTAETSWPWSIFKRLLQTKEIPHDLVTQLQTIETKAEIATVTNLDSRVMILENLVANIKMPQIQITSGNRQDMSSWTSWGNYSNDFTKNYLDIFPPSGYTMANLHGVVPSIAFIAYAGDVDDNDIIWCLSRVQSDRVRIICGSFEQRTAAAVNYVAIWIK